MDPGFYHAHLEIWLKEYKRERLFLIDSDVFKEQPDYYMNKIQKFFGLKQFIDYKKILYFDEQKSFFCMKMPNSTKRCLGSGKGRKYEEIDEQSFVFLKELYTEPNKNLKSLLLKHGYDIPQWLNE